MKKHLIVALAVLMLFSSGAMSVHADSPPAPAAVSSFWVPTNTEKVLRNAPFPNNPMQTLNMEAAKNEYESGQVILKATDTALTGVNASITNLTVTGGGTAVIPASSIQLYREHYIQVTTPTTGAYPTGWYPDALIPLKPNSVFDVPLGQNQGVWLTVKVPKGQQPGDYQGQLTLQANETSFQVPITFRVWDFELGDTPHTQTAFAITSKQLADYHGVTPNMPEYWTLMENYYWAQLEYRVASGDLPIPTDDVDEYILKAEPFLTDPRVNSFRIPYYEGNPTKTKDLVDKLRNKGWLSKGYFYVWSTDEPEDDDDYSLVQQISNELKTIAPDAKFLVTKEPVPELTGYVNTWAPLLHNYDRNAAQARLAAGDHLWWYTCVVPQHPYPSYHIDDDLLGARLLSWMQRENKIEGNLFWSTTFFLKYDGNQDVERDVWNDPMAFPGANGDGFLLYPGRDHGINGPIPSIRLDAIREGLEDYEYLWLLEDRMKAAAQQLGIASFDVDAEMKSYYDRLYKSVSRYDEEPERLLQARREIAERIVALQQSPLALVTSETVEDLKQQVTIYVGMGTSVALEGQTLSPTEQHGQYAVYTKTVDVQPGINELQLTVSGNGVSREQTIVLFGQDPTPPVYKTPLNYAETSQDLSHWQGNSVNLSLSTEHVTQGNHSLKADYTTNVEFPNVRLFGAGTAFPSADWSKYISVNFDVYNPNNTQVMVAAKFFDENNTANDTHPIVIGPNSSKSVSISLNELGNLDLTRMKGIELWMKPDSPTTVYFDNFHFLGYEQLPVIPLNYAETNEDLARWQGNNVNLSLSTEHVTQGSHSLKADYTTNVEFPSVRLFGAGTAFPSADWSKYITVNFDVYNPNNTQVMVAAKFFDEDNTPNDTHPIVIGPNSSQSVSIPLNELGNLDLSRMKGIELWMHPNTPTTVYFDNFHFLGYEPLTVTPLNYAETSQDLDRWQGNNVNLSLSSQHVTQGNYSMKADYTTNVEFPSVRLFGAGTAFPSADWSKYLSVNFDVYNPNNTQVMVAAKFFDENNTPNDTHPIVIGPNSSQSVSIPLNELSNLDLTHMKGIELWMKPNNPTTVYFDNFRFLGH
ncbi:glycoside hydrolase domain-containing protein [Cohnella sp. WQ 127256]|uniref:DUF4091 domain-containing protein n=1 Tax=Cohnella sp. WQ 127256 TaxID=2938790 RepID=UPI0021173BA1